MPRDDDVRIVNGNRFLDRIKNYLTPYASTLGKKIVIAQGSVPPKDIFGLRDPLHIIFDCIPDVRHRERALSSRAYGVAINVMAFEPKPEAVIIKDFFGVPVAEIFEGRLYFAVDFGRSHPENREKEVVGLVMNDYLLFVNDRAKFDEAMTERVADDESKKLAYFYWDWLKDAMDCDGYYGLDELEESVQERRRELVRAVRQREQFLQSRNRNKGLLGKKDPTYTKKVYENLCKLSVTGKITIDRESITIPVGQIDIEYDGTIYDIGEFEVVLHPGSGDVYCFNTTRTADEDDGCHHPHVNDDGECCFGNIEEGIAILMGEMELDVVVGMVIEFLKTWDEVGCYCSVDNWPVKGSEEAEDEDDESEDEDDDSESE